MRWYAEDSSVPVPHAKSPICVLASVSPSPQSAPPGGLSAGQRERGQQRRRLRARVVRREELSVGDEALKNDANEVMGLRYAHLPLASVQSAKASLKRHVLWPSASR